MQRIWINMVLCLLLCSFGVLILVVLSGRPTSFDIQGRPTHILEWVHACMAGDTKGDLKDPSMEAPEDAVHACMAGDTKGDLKDPSMEAPEDVVLRVTELALRCTGERTASRPSMGDIANELLAVRNEVAGREESSAALQVDAEVHDKRIVAGSGRSLDTEIRVLNAML
ncbi:unnamed protein product [Closterium sp. Naga37s-1]|nr:unnamed protein product [Closterium sp. Naga37s-1]